jgi:alginate O-acetyltransferase complex protein AlgI
VPRKFEFDKAADGVKQILWGLFKKVVIADNLAFHVDYIFTNYESLPASVLVMGAVFFTFQIYGDFSGYSDIAIGTSQSFWL